MARSPLRGEISVIERIALIFLTSLIVGPVDGSTLLRKRMARPGRMTGIGGVSSLSAAALSNGCPWAVGPFGTASGQRCQ